ncbi:MAG: hypothetical protein HY852_21285 [Bradyrhizobium sp.]|uniref:hypothetical protein n=1 Tax=Bradyrhizobium sp. TaxID=376 RepID=UPI0025BCED79|nr:hypothetical protein [Bradyrhizobium sp.]MBI5264340.1 hypothetical protein [Bradyrhizobium sp.]
MPAQLDIATVREHRIRAAFVAVTLAAPVIIIVTVAQPLLVYSLTLATFGLAHVLSELRYVDRRFSRSLERRELVAIAVLLLGALAARISGVSGLVGIGTALPVELGFVVAMALSVARGSLAQRGLAATIGTALGAATFAAPFDTAVSLSILHNLTPLAFLWELAPRRSRTIIILVASIVFVALPLLVATGLPRLVLQTWLPATSALDPLAAGPLASQLYVYVPSPLLHRAEAIDLFSASVVAQCAHYAAVIIVLPTMLAARDPEAQGIVPWPKGVIFAALLAAASAFAAYRFSLGFVSARALYAIAASVHAWIEVPLIVIALSRGTDQPSSSSPTLAEAALASAETASARRAASPQPQ